MPVYRRISLEELREWLIELKHSLKQLYDYPSKDVVLYLVVSLYEYVQVYSKLCLVNVEEVENVKITVKDIKNFVNDVALFPLANTFKTLRDAVSHGYVPDSMFNDKFLDFICEKEFVDFLAALKMDRELIDLFTLVAKRLKICFTDKYRSDCFACCKEMMKVKESGSSENTVSDVLNALKSDYDLKTINESILSISSSYVVTRHNS